MRPTGPPLALIAVLLLSGCQTVAGRGAGEVGAGFGAAVSAPFEDLNLKRPKIPPILSKARAGPYEVEGLAACDALAAEIGALDLALGPDSDAPPPQLSDAQKDADRSAKATLEVVRSAARSTLPFHDWVSRLSGADRRRHDVEAAIRAGVQRRAFLKGRGMAMNCAPPAAPFGFMPPPREAIATKASARQ